MNAASEARIAISRLISAAYEPHPNVRMTAVGGSAARGQADRWSDADMAVYWEDVDAVWLDEPRFSGEGVERAILYNVAEADPRIWLEQYFVDGIKVDVAHLPLDWFASEIAAVVEHFDTTPDRQETLEGAIDSIPLYNEPLYRQWLGRLDPYPGGLREAMVAANLRFPPAWTLTGQGLERGDLLAYYDNLIPILKGTAGVLAGLNRRYLCTAKLKRIDQVLATFELAPPRAVEHVRALLECREVDRRYDDLAESVLTLVERELPAFDTTQARWIFQFGRKELRES